MVKWADMSIGFESFDFLDEVGILGMLFFHVLAT
jgi:hypothetical protein